LNRLGDKFGFDFSSAAGGFGLDGSARGARSGDTDFEPRTDIFDAPSHYTVHVSLPGAKKPDIGVEWDGEHSVLRVAGVVHRPFVDEEMMSHLAVDGRKRDTGVFEKSIRLGTRKEPANVDVPGISATMVDGVLVVRVPKLHKTFERREVRLASSSSPEIPVERPEDVYMHEEVDLLDEDFNDDRHHDDMYDDDITAPAAAAPAATQPPTANQPYPAKASMSSDNGSNLSSKGKEKEREAERERSATLGLEHANETVDTLPRYEPQEAVAHGHHANDEAQMSDWEKDDEEEGEYIKINVD
jgi:HSP20 family molecular chaperone IbpA